MDGLSNLERQLIFALTNAPYRKHGAPDEVNVFSMNDRWPSFTALMANVYWTLLPPNHGFSPENTLHAPTVGAIVRLLSRLLGRMQKKRARAVVEDESDYEWGDEDDSDDDGNGEGEDKCRGMISRTGCTSHGAMGNIGSM